MSRRRPSPWGLAFLVVIVSACSPRLPTGVDTERLQEAISAGIGDPATCVLIGTRGSAKVAFRYNTRTTCARELPTCVGAARGTVGDLLRAVASDGQARAVSCSASDDGTRGVAWAAGPVSGRDLVYAAVMEGERTLPGHVMADRLAGAFKDAGL